MSASAEKEGAYAAIHLLDGHALVEAVKAWILQEFAKAADLQMGSGGGVRRRLRPFPSQLSQPCGLYRFFHTGRK